MTRPLGLEKTIDSQELLFAFEAKVNDPRFTAIRDARGATAMELFEEFQEDLREGRIPNLQVEYFEEVEEVPEPHAKRHKFDAVGAGDVQMAAAHAAAAAAAAMQAKRNQAGQSALDAMIAAGAGGGDESSESDEEDDDEDDPLMGVVNRAAAAKKAADGLA